MNKLFVDTETTGLNPYKDYLQLIGYANGDGQIEIINFLNHSGLFL